MYYPISTGNIYRPKYCLTEKYLYSWTGLTKMVTDGLRSNEESFKLF